MGLFSPSFQVEGSTFFLGGATQGLGLSVAVLLVKKGAAHVAIVSRNASNVQLALQEIEKARVNPDQKITGGTCDLTQPGACEKALDEAFPKSCPDVVMSITGSAGNIMGYFHKMSVTTFQKGLDVNYNAALYTSHAATRRMIEYKVKGKIVFVSSLLGYFGLAGYSAYSPPKFAVRGLADSLRSELQLFGIDVHCHFPATIYTPGYEVENQTKPELTKAIEGTDEGSTPDQLAKRLIQGIENGNFHITTDILGNIFRSSHRATVPMNSCLDCVYSVIGDIGLPIWRYFTDRQIRSYAADSPEKIA